MHGERKNSELEMGFAVERVLISDNVDSICEKTLRDAGIEADRKLKLPKEQLIEELQVNEDCFYLA